MEKDSKKISIGLILMLFTILIGYDYINTPKLITELKTNTVYLGHWKDEYPSKQDDRFYIKLNDDKSFVWLYDNTRRKYYTYEDGHPNMEIVIGKYTVENGNYTLHYKGRAELVFEDARAIKNKVICQYEKYDCDETVKMYRQKNNGYVLPGRTDDATCFLYNKSDIKELPNTLEEFRKQYTMNEKTHQKYLDRGYAN